MDLQLNVYLAIPHNINDTISPRLLLGAGRVRVAVRGGVG